MNMEGEVQQHTNVVGSVYGVDITHEGHILYTDFRQDGFRIKMLANTKRKMMLWSIRDFTWRGC